MGDNILKNTQVWHAFGFIIGDALPTERTELLGVVIEPIQSEEFIPWLKGPSYQINFPEGDNHWFAIIPPEKGIFSHHLLYCTVTIDGNPEGQFRRAQEKADLRFRRATSALSIAMPNKERCRYKLTRMVQELGNQAGICSSISWFRLYNSEVMPSEAITNIHVISKNQGDDVFERACKCLEDGQRVEDFAGENKSNLSDAFLHYFRGIELISNRLTSEWRENTKDEILSVQLEETIKLQSELNDLTGFKRIAAIKKTAQEIDKIAENFISAKIARAFSVLRITPERINEKDLIRLRHQITHGGVPRIDLKDFKEQVAEVEQLAREVICKYICWLNENQTINGVKLNNK